MESFGKHFWWKSFHSIAYAFFDHVDLNIFTEEKFPTVGSKSEDLRRHAIRLPI
jgi:hypothetical protein